MSLVEDKLAEDYSNYFLQNDIAREIVPINITIEEMITRLEEYESLLQIVSIDTNEIQGDQMIKINNFKTDFDKLCQQIDNLENLIRIIMNNLTTLEKQIDVAEVELDIPEKPIEILMKTFNIFSKTSKLELTNRDNRGVYVAPEIFSCNEIFKKEKLEK